MLLEEIIINSASNAFKQEVLKINFTENMIKIILRKIPHGSGKNNLHNEPTIATNKTYNNLFFLVVTILRTVVKEYIEKFV
jgi:hypothetical protein